MRLRPLLLLSILLMSSPAMSAQPAAGPLDMMASTVRVKVEIDETPIKKNGKPNGETIKDGWTGSGVVYDKKGDKSLILSANHVLETPAVGSIKEDKIDFLGMEMSLGKFRVDAVKITVDTFDGRTCNAKVLALGHSDERDTATAEVDCDAGRVAPIATSTPARGEKVFISGHPMGIPLAMVTEGYVSGPMKIDAGTFTLVSGAAFGGNSGGPVFYNGEVIGLLVRGVRTYPHISLVTPLEQVRVRVGETPTL